MMRRVIVVAFGLMLVASAATLSARSGRVPVIVMFKDRADAALIQHLGGSIKSVYRFEPAVAASIPDAAVDALRKNPRVAYVVQDLPIEKVGQSVPWGVERIGATTVHASGNNGTGVNVAILDTGIDKDHPDLSYVWGYDFSGQNDPDPEDYDGHGTHVAGIVAALDNDIGVVGVAPEANLYILKIFTDSGSGSYSDAVEALEWCIGTYSDGVEGNEIKVISMSWGSNVEYGDPGIEPWINKAYNMGILLIGAAGNEGNPPGKGDNVIYPARYDNVVAVAATDSDDSRARWSSTGPAVELSAPGVSIYSTYLNGGYATMSGTSMACPHVSGTAALVFASAVDSSYDFDHDGVWDNDEVRAKLQDTADDLGPAGRDEKYGYGLVDADEACGVSVSPPSQGTMFSDISMTYTTRGPFNWVYTKVTVVDEANNPVSGATVYVETTLPDLSVQSFSGETGSDGVVTFSLKSRLTGTYTSTVTDVVKSGWTYDEANSVTSASLTIQ